MIALQIARILANLILFFDNADEETLDLDAGVQAMEVLSHDLEQLDKAFLRELVDAFATIAPEYGPETEPDVRRIPYDFYLEELLAADDPVRLAELEAIRDAEPPMQIDDLTGRVVRPSS